MSLRRSFVARWLWRYVNGPAPQFAPALAFTAFVAIFPITVGVVSLLLLITPGPRVPAAVDRLILEIFPEGTRREIGTLLLAVPRHEKTIVVVSFIAMLWSGSALFSCLGGALNAIHGTTGRNMIRQRVVGLRLIGVMIGALSVVLLLESLSDQLLPRIPLVGALLAAVPLMMLLGFIYARAPNHKSTPGKVLPGALLATVGIELVTMAFPVYSRVADTTNLYGRGLGLALVMLFWLYLVSHLVLLGAAFNEMRAGAGRA
ncbi:MAG TPA: YihY/virulence factor BrkB family protein [Candidatus Dormibacteraeota bacterium]|jgi:YihY family inner membrane protein